MATVLSVNIELCSARLREDCGGHSGRKEATTLSTTATAKFRVEDCGGGDATAAVAAVFIGSREALLPAQYTTSTTTTLNE